MDRDVAIWVVAAGIPGVVCLALVAVLWHKLRVLRAEQEVLLAGGDRGGLVERQAALARSVTQVETSVSALRTDVETLARETQHGLRGAVRFQAIVRYDAYADMGGEQSWSMALLNADKTGAVISALHAREHARMYFKEVVAGVPTQTLSPEEAQAVAQAMTQPGPVITLADGGAR